MVRTLATLALVPLVLLAAGCSGVGDVGEQDGEKSVPVASVVVLNQPFSIASDKVTTRVRSGTQVVLSGKDSDGAAFPVVDFKWKVVTTGAVASQIRLIPRNANTVVFDAPQLPANTSTVLQFRLTVTDAKGNEANKDVDVTVVGVPDNNHFLSYNLDTPRKFKVVAIASQDVAPDALAADVGFDITVKKLVDYKGNGSYVELGNQVIHGSWLKARGAGASCDNLDNPNFEVDVPAVNIDDILAVIDTKSPEQKPNAALVDSYDVKLQITIAPTSGSLPNGVQPLVCAPEVPEPMQGLNARGHFARLSVPRPYSVQTSDSGMLEVSLDQVLSLDSAPLETRQTATAYYEEIDPEHERTNLLDWLKHNGMSAPGATAVKWDELQAVSSAHAVYTNNYDLGFGRDMYAKLGACDPGFTAPQLGSPLDKLTVGHCDVAAVVINYASLEAAAKKLNPQLAVAMEFSAAPGTNGRRIVKFFVFAPNTDTGEFRRVLSANLDGRGERYVPQVCTVCHGGTPVGVDGDGVYLNGGDVRATFLMWDLDSFLYSGSDVEGEVDRSFTEETLRAQYTRSAQAPQLMRLNQLAYLTFYDPQSPNRYVLTKQLAEGWYGGGTGPTAFTNTAFSRTYVPDGWKKAGLDGVADTTDDNPDGSEKIYRDVFARQCRACHIAHDPDSRAEGARLEMYAVDDTHIYNTCDKPIESDGNITEPTSIGTANQVPMACYRQFLNAPALPERLANGQMPFARLSMDRLWTSGADSTPSHGDDLLAHLRAEYTATGNQARLAAVGKPGVPRPKIELLSATPNVPVDLGATVKLDGTGSLFATGYQWQLDLCQSSGSLVPQCRGTNPPTDTTSINCVAAIEPVVGAQSPFAAFSIGGTGFYRAQLSVPGGEAPASSLLSVPDWKPCNVAGANTELGNVTVGSPAALPASLFTTGNGANKLFVSTTAPVTITPAACDSGQDAGAQGCAADTAVSITPQLIGGPYTVSVSLLDEDGEGASVDVHLSGVSSLAASPITVTDLFANGSTSVDLLNGRTGVTFQLLDRVCPNGVTVAKVCLTNPDNTNNAVNFARLTQTATGFTYFPPANYSTHSSDGAPGAGRSLEQVRYRLVNASNPNDFSNESTVDLPVRALIKFDDLKLIFTQAPCNECHEGGAGPQYQTFDYDTWRNGNLIHFARARVNLTTPASSGLYCYPTESDGCSTNHDVDADTYGAGGTGAARVQAILNWLSSGANPY